VPCCGRACGEGTRSRRPCSRPSSPVWPRRWFLLACRSSWLLRQPWSSGWGDTGPREIRPRVTVTVTSLERIRCH